MAPLWRCRIDGTPIKEWMQTNCQLAAHRIELVNGKLRAAAGSLTNDEKPRSVKSTNEGYWLIWEKWLKFCKEKPNDLATL